MTHLGALTAILTVCLATVAAGALGLRLSRTTSDFYVAGRSVSARRNASAISGEYLSAASFLGVAGAVYATGADSLWLPVGYTGGYLVLLVLVAAPLRRSGAYTLADFAEMRMESRTIRLMCSLLVVGVSWLYLVPQFQGAGITMGAVTGWPPWVGSLIVMAVVILGVAGGGMRSITLVQAMQYWIKLSAISIPACVLLVLWLRDGTPRPARLVGPHGGLWVAPHTGFGGGGHDVYLTLSLLVALCLGTMGLPHVAVRFYTNPDGRAARRTTVVVIALLSLFYLFTPVYGVLGRIYLPHLPDGVTADTIALRLPAAMTSGPAATLLGAILAGGAFAAFLSTASGVAMSAAGALDQDLLRPLLRRWTGDDVSTVHSFRYAAVTAVLVPYAASHVLEPLGLATTVGLAFAITSATFSPLLILGIWWRRLSRTGALAGLLVGGVLATASVAGSVTLTGLTGWPAALLSQPAAWCVPLATAVTVLVSLATPAEIPRSTAHTLVRLHTPESVHPG